MNFVIWKYSLQIDNIDANFNISPQKKSVKEYNFNKFTY